MAHHTSMSANPSPTRLIVVSALALAATAAWARPQGLDVVPVEGQPLAANAARVLQALDFLGAPLTKRTAAAVKQAVAARDAHRIQQLLDAHVLFTVTINSERSVKVARGAGRAVLQQGGYTPVLVKVVNLAAARSQLRIASPESGPVYAGVAPLSMERQRQQPLRENENAGRDPGRFLQVEMFTQPPMTPRLSGLEVEYTLALLYSSAAGKRPAAITFDLGAGAQEHLPSGQATDLHGEAAVLLDVRPAVPVTLRIHDADGRPTAARLAFHDAAGHVYPPQPKRLAPDFFFQRQIYRNDGGKVLLPPGELTMSYSRGPEYRQLERNVTIPAKGGATLDIRLQRWIDPAAYGYYSGDHHIHGAGCAHYSSPTEGVSPEDMFLNVKGEGLNVGCVLTWGPCFAFQRRFFSPAVDRVSEPLTILKYDLEISGFGSQALGHVCLLNLKDQTYPGSNGTTDAWPTWTTPVLRWAKAQGAVTGYAHSASGLQIDPPAAARRLLERLDDDRDGRLTPEEAARGLLPEAFSAIDTDRDGLLTLAELTASHDRAADRLPNLAIPEMNGVGAMEACVSAAEGVCDFISSMDTSRIQEWNTWYHLLNCGFPVKTSGETDFPCMSGTRVGQGRVYVRLGKVDRLDFAAWCEGLRAGRSYVSDGYAHAVGFMVNGRQTGETLDLKDSGEVEVRARVAFAPGQPLDVAHGSITPAGGRRIAGDTVNKHDPVQEGRFTAPGEPRRVEVVVNGQPVAAKDVPADGRVHDLAFRVRIDRSSWVALRQFPQLHTNPVDVLVGGRPIRASRRSAEWCVGVIEQLWRNRERAIAPQEREEARRTFDRAIARYRRIAGEAAEGS